MYVVERTFPCNSVVNSAKRSFGRLMKRIPRCICKKGKIDLKLAD